METYLFYILAAVSVIATIFAITEKHPVHAIVYLVTSFFSLAVIFYLLSAPMIAVFEVIIYAGAVMVLFLFVIMMLDLGHPEKASRPGLTHWAPAMACCTVIAISVILMAWKQFHATASGNPVSIRDFSIALFRRYGVVVEIISMQLLFAVVGALYLGRKRNG